jgi:hypothetical protein
MAPYIRLLLLLLAALFYSCKGGVKKSAYALPASAEINEAVQAVVHNALFKVPICSPGQDTEQAAESNALSATKPLSVDLCRLRILAPPTARSAGPPPPPLPPGSEYITSMQQLEIQGKPFFDRQDSAYLLFQSDNLLSFRLSKTDEQHIRYTNRPYLDSLYRATGHIAAFESSIPLFSANGKKAYMTLTFQCEGSCAYSLAFLLEKKDSRWQVLKGWVLWYS